jgi:glucokinase
VRTVGVDIGGTKVAAGVVDENGKVLAAVRRETPHRTTSPSVVADTIADAVAELRTVHPDVAAVGIGAAGFVDAEGAYVRFAPHLSWRDEPLRDAMRERLGLPVTVDNDANAALWAEVQFGAARGETDVLCVNLGTGIGGALLVAGRLHRGASGMAGEFGHMQVVPGGRACECGRTGCWEQYASGNVIARAARVIAKAGNAAGSPLLSGAGGDATRVTGHVVTEAARAGDPTALRLLGEVGEWLGLGLANLVSAFDPALVIVGGGLSEAGELLLAPARETFAEALPGREYRPVPRIVPAALGNNAGLVGAADLARRALDARLGDPA